MGKKRGQAWSFDVILAVIIFVTAFFVFYFLLKPRTEKPVDTLRQDAEFIAHELLSNSSPFYIVESGKINETKLQDLIGNYPALKNRIKVANDFCIYLEDEEGNIISINTNVLGVGSSKIIISDKPCS